MPRRTYGAEQARQRLPELLERAHHGSPTVITKRGRPYAALVPLDRGLVRTRRSSLLALRGSGAGLWGRDAARTVSRMRDEWT
ncbi:MAG: type II toxin-antitoxin system prevent-host-death family antitoxin [Myxococcota bacterium]